MEFGGSADSSLNWTPRDLQPTQDDDQLQLALHQFPLDLAELILHALQRGGASDQEVELKVVADRHLVEEPSELGLQQREPLGQPLAP